MSYQTCETCGLPPDIEYGCVCEHDESVTHAGPVDNDATPFERNVLRLLIAVLITLIVYHAI